jgi:hypothetical protein
MNPIHTGYSPVPSWIPTLPKLGSILGFSQRLLRPFSPIAIKAKNNLLSLAHGHCRVFGAINNRQPVRMDGNDKPPGENELLQKMRW